jgi:hypothetical protein
LRFITRPNVVLFDQFRDPEELEGVRGLVGKGGEAAVAAVGGFGGVGRRRVEVLAEIGFGGFGGFVVGRRLFVFNEDWLCFVEKRVGSEALLAHGEELFEGAVVGAREAGFVAGELGEGVLAAGEGEGEGGVDGFVGVGLGEIGDADVEEAGFDADAAFEADFERGQLFDEGGFVLGCGVPGVEEGLEGGGEQGAVFAEGGDVLGAGLFMSILV